MLKLLTGITCEEGGKCGENFYSIYFWVFFAFFIMRKKNPCVT